MKILLTGGAGFIGSAVVRQLIRETDAEVVNVDKLTYAGNLASLAEAGDDPRHHFERVDICDADEVARVFEEHRPDAVMHLAAESHVDRSIDGPGEFIRTNVVGTFTLLQAARAYWERLEGGARDRFRFHHVSTDEVYGSLGAEGYFTEETPYDPSSPYSASKAASDHLVRAWHHTYGLPTLVTNCSNNYGPYHFPEKLIPLVILNAKAGKPLPIYGKGDNVRDWLYVDDHARALRLVLEKGDAGRDVQHRRPQRADQPRGRPGDLPPARRDAARLAARPARRPDHLRRRPAGARPAVRHRRRQDRARAGLAAGRDVRDRPEADGRLVPGERGLVPRRPVRRLPPGAARPGGPPMNPAPHRRPR